MVRRNKQKPTDEIFVESSALSSEDERLNKLFDEMEQGSLKTVEDAARQIITLSTTLLGAFFGLLAFKDAPSYLGFLEIKIIGTGALLAFLISMFFALRAISPRQYEYPHSSLTAKRKILNDMVMKKKRDMNLSAWLFGVGAFLMLFSALDILIFRI